MMVFNTVILYLGNMQRYTGWLGNVAIHYANGAIKVFPMLLVQVQLLRDDNASWSQWIEEEAILQPLSPGVSRLLGVGIRRAVYLGTALDNHFLNTTATKGGLASLL